MGRELAKTYDPKGIEDRLYQKWLDKKYFHAEVDRTKKPFTIVIPPPNITGQLHMGHALDNTMQDILIRYKRMQGYNALWQPGTDHASIATEVKIIEKLKEEGIDKNDLGREGFLERAWDWKKEYGGTIVIGLTLIIPFLIFLLCVAVSTFRNKILQFIKKRKTYKKIKEIGKQYLTKISKNEMIKE